MDLFRKYPSIPYLKEGARRRIPHFVWEYLDSATGTEATKRRNRASLDSVLFWPSILHGEFTPDLGADLMGHRYPLPFGIAPVGMSGLVWPGAERILATTAAQAGLPYGLSTLASQPPESIGPHAGAHGWFQLYPPLDEGIRKDMLKRALSSGFETLILTVDAPVPSRRERQYKSGLAQPPKLTLKLLAQVMARPEWAVGMARAGTPRLRTIEPYLPADSDGTAKPQLNKMLRTSPDIDYVRWLRANWNGRLVIKGVMRAEDIPDLESAGADAIWISNHAGRQFDGAPATVDVLPAIREATRLPIICDSGIEGALDILRMLALGADFVMLGRAFHYALAALGEAGPAHLVDMLKRDLIANMGQIGARDLHDLAPRLASRNPAHPSREAAA